MKPIGYYQGILQIRNPTKELVEFVKKAVKKDPNNEIARRITVKNGYDFYMTSNKFLMRISKKFPESFSGQLKVTRKLYSVNRLTSKQIWRVTVMFRLPDFKIGDTIRVRRKQVKVVKMGEKLMGYEVESGKKITFKYSDIK